MPAKEAVAGASARRRGEGWPERERRISWSMLRGRGGDLL